MIPEIKETNYCSTCQMGIAHKVRMRKMYYPKKAPCCWRTNLAYMVSSTIGEKQ